MKHTSICDYPLKRASAGDTRLINQISRFLITLRVEYPEFQEWFNQKVKSGLMDGSRQIWGATSSDGRLVGILILKDCVSEKKICTLFVHDAFRRQGIGTLLMKKAIQQLKTERPLATVSSLRISEYQRLMDQFGFQLSMIYNDYYRNGISEYSFNGTLVSSEYTQASNE